MLHGVASDVRAIGGDDDVFVHGIPPGCDQDLLPQPGQLGRQKGLFTRSPRIVPIRGKGNSGRPYQILFARNYPIAELRLDNTGTNGEILILDVLVNRVAIDSLESELRIHADERKFLRYTLADEMAGEYGKALSRRQVKIMDDAYDKLAAGGLRMNMLSVDRALRSRPRYNINHGDP